MRNSRFFQQILKTTASCPVGACVFFTQSLVSPKRGKKLIVWRERAHECWVRRPVAPANFHSILVIFLFALVFLSPRAAYKAASEVAYLSHHVIVVIVSMDRGGGTPPPRPYLVNWSICLPLYLFVIVSWIDGK